jgi:uncharacterized protein YndB with AHSA1/START domain
MTKKKMQFSTTIDAPRRDVWTWMLAPDTYTDWTQAFMEGSYYEGSFDKGARVRFLTPGGKEGMVAEVVENRPGEFVSLKHLGEIKDGVEDFDSPQVKAWAPAFENYRFVDKDGATEVQIEMDVMPAYEDFMREAWPKALARLKALCEERATA